MEVNPHDEALATLTRPDLYYLEEWIDFDCALLGIHDHRAPYLDLLVRHAARHLQRMVWLAECIQVLSLIFGLCFDGAFDRGDLLSRFSC